MTMSAIAPEALHTFSNGRTYKVVDTHKPFVDGEYPTGGFLISTLLTRSGEWSFVDYAPDEESVQSFLRAAAKLPARKN